MNYYKIALISSPLEQLTYSSTINLQNGAIVVVIIKTRKLSGVVVSECKQPEFETTEICEVSELHYSTKQIELTKFISTYYICSLGDAFSLMLGYEDSTCETHTPNLNIPIILSQKQETAFNFLKKHKVSLLFGDTGSGKTEVYMKYFEEMLEKKKAFYLLDARDIFNTSNEFAIRKTFW